MQIIISSVGCLAGEYELVVAAIVTSGVTQIFGQLSDYFFFAIFRITAAVVQSFSKRDVPGLVSAWLLLVAFV